MASKPSSAPASQPALPENANTPPVDGAPSTPAAAAAPAQGAKPTPAPRPARMSVGNVKRGIVRAPVRLVLHGVEGVGKTEFAAGAEGIVFLASEKGSFNLDVNRFPEPRNYRELFDALRSLRQDQHQFKAVAIDTLDWLEPVIFREVCRGADARSIEDVGGGYGKGYQRAVDLWRDVLAALEDIWWGRKMHILLLAHSHVTTFKNPNGADYDRYTMKLQKLAAGVLKEWPETVLFANFKTQIQVGKQRVDAAGGQEMSKKGKVDAKELRVIYTQRRPAWDAKNRYRLPPEMPLSWDAFMAGVEKGQQVDPGRMREEIAAAIARLADKAEAEKAAAALGRAGADQQKLIILDNWVATRLDTQDDTDIQADEAPPALVAP